MAKEFDRLNRLEMRKNSADTFARIARGESLRYTKKKRRKGVRTERDSSRTGGNDAESGESYILNGSQ